MRPKEELNIWKRKSVIAIAAAFIINPLSHFLQNVLGIGSLYYASYFCWALLFLLFFSGGRIVAIKSRIVVAGALMLGFLIGAIFGEVYLGEGVSSLYIGVVICIAYVSTMCRKNIREISNRELFFLLRIVVIIGVVACLYAVVFQFENLILILRGINVSWNSWKYVSFFRQRNVFAQCCFISTIAACYLFLKSKKKFYVGCIILYGIQIFLTNSRAGLLGYVVLVGLCFYFTRKNKVVLAIFCVITAIFALYAFDIGSILLEGLKHETASGEETGAIRVAMWVECLKYLWGKVALLGGFGLNGTIIFLTPEFGVGSSHNAFVDALFNGGLIYVITIISAVVSSYRICAKNRKDIEFGYVWKAAIIAYTFYCMLEAGMMLFGSNYFSVTITLLIISIPRLYVEELNESQR